MLSLGSDIRINDKYIFTNLVDCKVSSSWNDITTIAEIRLRNFILNNKTQELKNEIKRGQSISFDLGYNSTKVRRFDGYITKTNTDSPFTIFAEDQAWILKQKAITKYSAKDLTVKSLLNNLLGILNIDLTMNIIDADIGTWAVQNSTIIQVLDELKSKFGMLSFFRDGELFVGYPSLLASQFPAKYGVNEHTFYFDGENANIINHSLVWQDKTDINQVIKGTVIQRDNTKVTKYAFYLNGVASLTLTQPEGNIITRFQYNITQAEMDAYLLRELPLINYTGWNGNFTTFGDEIRPNLGGVVQHGDSVNLITKKEPEKNGKYLVKSVSLDFGQGGYRQTIELDQQL